MWDPQETEVGIEEDCRRYSVKEIGRLGINFGGKEGVMKVFC